MAERGPGGGDELLWPADGVRPERVRGPRWGLRALGWLALAALCITVSSFGDGHTLGTAAGLIAGLIGAGHCSWRGLQQFREHGAA